MSRQCSSTSSTGTSPATTSGSSATLAVAANSSITTRVVNQLVGCAEIYDEALDGQSAVSNVSVWCRPTLAILDTWRLARLHEVRMRNRQLSIYLTPCVWASLAGAAQAVTDIRFEHWGVASTTIARDTTPPIDSVTTIGVSFDARSTLGDADPTKGLRFAIAERDPDGNDVLVRFAVAPCTATPRPGSEVTISARVDLYCDRESRLQARNGVGWLVNWCDISAPRACYRDGAPAAGLPAVSEPEKFELVVVDENDAEGSFPTPEDALVVRQGGPAGPPE